EAPVKRVGHTNMGLGLWQMLGRTLMVHKFSSVTTTWLDGCHVVFGKVLSGIDVVYKTEAECN
ncbi:Peptidyl-prolyl cis-trans isomerase, microsomal, partial [Olea europaea subsp. europaea]